MVAKEKEEYIQKYANSFTVKLSEGQGSSRIADNDGGGELHPSGFTFSYMLIFRTSFYFKFLKKMG